MKSSYKLGFAVVCATLGFFTLGACQTAFDSVDSGDQHVMWFIRPSATHLTITHSKVSLAAQDYRDLAGLDPIVWPMWLCLHQVQSDAVFSFEDNTPTQHSAFPPRD